VRHGQKSLRAVREDFLGELGAATLGATSAIRTAKVEPASESAFGVGEVTGGSLTGWAWPMQRTLIGFLRQG
jgi:hypothetical protein